MHTNQVQYVSIDSDSASQRLDNYLICKLKGVPRSHIYQIIRSGQVRVNKGRKKINYRLQPGDNIRIPPIKTATTSPNKAPEKFQQFLQSRIIHEDEHILILNKPSGYAVHGGSGLSFGIIESLRESRTDIRFMELVHRLDKETSGCLVIAKNKTTLRELNEALRLRKIEKKYLAIVHNKWELGTKIVDAPLNKNTLKGGERIVSVNSNGKEAQTKFSAIQSCTSISLIQATPYTGRTHQIRVHAATCNHSIVGDKKYTTSQATSATSKRLMLHARSICIEINNKEFKIKAPVDKDFNDKLLQYGLNTVL